MRGDEVHQGVHGAGASHTCRAGARLLAAAHGQFRVLTETSHESVPLGTLHAQQTAAELQVPPLGHDKAAHQGQQLGVVVRIAYHTLILPCRRGAEPILSLALLLLTTGGPSY